MQVLPNFGANRSLLSSLFVADYCIFQLVNPKQGYQKNI